MARSFSTLSYLFLMCASFLTNSLPERHRAPRHRPCRTRPEHRRTSVSYAQRQASDDVIGDPRQNTEGASLVRARDGVSAFGDENERAHGQNDRAGVPAQGAPNARQFPPGGSADARASTGRPIAASALSVARPLHARPHGRSQILHEAIGHRVLFPDQISFPRPCARC